MSAKPGVRTSSSVEDRRKKKSSALSATGPSRARIGSGSDIEDIQDTLGNHAATGAFTLREAQPTKQLTLKGFTKSPTATGNHAVNQLSGASPIHGSVYLFSLDPVFIDELDRSQTRGAKSDELLREFESRVKPLSPKREVTVEEAGKAWRIDDAGAKYIINRQNTLLDVYMAIEDKGLSFELDDAPTSQKGESALLGLANENETRVFLWLEEHAREIAAAESKFRVDRRAIAGAIAWEALVNVKASSATLRAIGPGKVHYRTWMSNKTTIGSFDDKNKLWGEAETAAEQVENRGLLPQVTQLQRKEILKTPAGAIDYIGAIMSAFAVEAEKPHAGGWHGENIRDRPEILTNAYQGEDLNTWQEHLNAKRPGDKLEPGNDMAYWVRARLDNFLEPAVGAPKILPLHSLDRPGLAAAPRESKQGVRVLPTLRSGDKSEDARLLQRKLNSADLTPLRLLPEDGIFGPTTESHVREFQRRRGLKDDGIVGPQTWRALPEFVSLEDGKLPLKQDTRHANNPSVSAAEPSWIPIARAEIGKKEIKGAKHEARVIEYLQTTGKWWSSDETPWCSGFVNWVMSQAGFTGTNSASAISWLNWGQKIDKPAYGAIGVISYGGSKGHVGFVIGKQDESILLLGGNQSDQVKISPFAKSKFSTFAFPKTYKIPPSAYALGESRKHHGKESTLESTR